jgi:hypothetical protein
LPFESATNQSPEVLQNLTFIGDSFAEAFGIVNPYFENSNGSPWLFAFQSSRRLSLRACFALAQSFFTFGVDFSKSLFSTGTAYHKTKSRSFLRERLGVTLGTITSRESKVIH